ncbi:MAG: NADH-quinone oxidoreductase subunit M [Elusimicrobia bacterium]|nr:NADH-quinone oxidoreductase subunit M [Elusimicrobiota bacterium]
MTLGWLSLAWMLPALFGAAAMMAGARARGVALWGSGLTLSLWFVLGWTYGLEGVESLSESGPVLAWGIRYALFTDGLSWSLCGLTAFLTLLSLLSSWRLRVSAAYWACFLWLEAALMGVFLARDLFLFYVFWEATLIPMFFIIGLWGSENRRHAAMKFFLFTFFGSLFLLLGLLGLVSENHRMTGGWNWDMAALTGPDGGMGLAIFLALILGFGVKVPIVPFHAWLPDAHTEAPAAGSVMLAGVMLKMGVYGILRVAIPAFPKLAWDLLPWLGLLAAVNVIYGAICAMAQSDLKRLVAYSSVSHLGFCLLGVFSRTPEGLTGGSLQLINHGLSTGALFLLVGFLYERAHRRGLADFGDLASRAPWMTLFFSIAIFSSIGLPGLNGFVGEFMSLAGMTRVFAGLAVAGVLGVALSAAYALPAYQAVFWREPGPGSVSAQVGDLDGREKAILWALTVLMFAIGLYPKPWLEMIWSAMQGLQL